MNFLNIIGTGVDEKGFVPDTIRDEFFHIVKNRPENRVCFDCESRNPTWLSLSFAVFICLNCSSNHRKMGVHISFVRSIDLDRFTPSQLARMSIGGNSRARNFFKQFFGAHFSSNTREYTNSIYGSKYKQVLDAEVSGLETSYFGVCNEQNTLEKTTNSQLKDKSNFLTNKKNETDSNPIPGAVNRFNSIQRQKSLINKGRRLDESFDFDSLVL
ncbi:putative GTPase activating protein for Arf family protein [Cryptosporidium felis]|nr:putative GTPase activating protein for Arf family protein [Cryptosporidium felis]